MQRLTAKDAKDAKNGHDSEMDVSMSEEAAETRIDISQVKSEEIAEGVFPAPYPACDFRVHIAADAHEEIVRHSRMDTRVELCGVLVGKVLKDKFGPFAVVEDIIRGEYAENRGAQVTFTQETWSHIFSVLDEKFPDQKIVGWYHTHPGFGIFLSPMDTFIQRNFFNLPWQVAFVIDPLGEQEGLFEWREGQPVASAQYWVGQTVHFPKQGRVVSFPEPAKAEEPSVPMAQPAAAQNAAGEEARPREMARAGTSVWSIVNFILLLLILGILLFRPQVESGMAWLLRWIRTLGT